MCAFVYLGDGGQRYEEPAQTGIYAYDSSQMKWVHVHMHMHMHMQSSQAFIEQLYLIV
jgi:hypothetical protein